MDTKSAKSNKKINAEKIMDTILEKFDSVESFVRAYLEDKLSKDDLKLAEKVIVPFIDLDNNPNNKAYEKLIQDIFRK